MKKQFAVMFCLLAIFTCLVGCSTGSKASFPEMFIGSVGQGETDALKTLGVTEQALSGYTVDVYGKTADVQLSFDAYRGDETSAGKLNYAELTVPCTPNGDGFSYMRTCYDKLGKSARRTVHDRREHGRRFRRRRYRYAFCGAAKRCRRRKHLRLTIPVARPR